MVNPAISLGSIPSSTFSARPVSTFASAPERHSPDPSRTTTTTTTRQVRAHVSSGACRTVRERNALE